MAVGEKRSPLAPKAFPKLPAIGGVRFASSAAEVKYKGRDDVMLAELAAGTAVAGVFTRSSTRAAPVLDCQRKIGNTSHESRAAILVNSGNANAFTGQSEERLSRLSPALLHPSFLFPKIACFHPPLA